MAFTDFKRKKAEICKFCGRLGSKNLQFKNLSFNEKTDFEDGIQVGCQKWFSKCLHDS